MIKVKSSHFIGIILATCLITAYAKPGVEVVTDKDNGTDFIQCESNSQGPMIGQIPGDPFNCNRFFYCVHAEPGSGFVTIPVEEWCPATTDGSLLFYDFRLCRCEFTRAGCYHDDDLIDFFTCADPINSDGTVALNLTRS